MQHGFESLGPKTFTGLVVQALMLSSMHAVSTASAGLRCCAPVVLPTRPCAFKQTCDPADPAVHHQACALKSIRLVSS